MTAISVRNGHADRRRSELKLRICHLQCENNTTNKVDHIRNSFVAQAEDFFRSSLGDVAEESIAQLFVIDLRSQGRLQKQALETALAVSMAYPSAVKLVSEPVLCRKRRGQTIRETFETYQRPECMNNASILS